MPFKNYMADCTKHWTTMFFVFLFFLFLSFFFFTVSNDRGQNMIINMKVEKIFFYIGLGGVAIHPLSEPLNRAILHQQKVVFLTTKKWMEEDLSWLFPFKCDHIGTLFTMPKLSPQKQEIRMSHNYALSSIENAVSIS